MKTRKKIGIAVIVLLVIAWGLRICQLRRHWEAMYPIKYVGMTGHFVQNGLEFHLIEYHWTTIEELAERFGEVPQEQQEIYYELFREEHPEFSYVVVTFEYYNPAEEDSYYPAYDIILSGDMRGSSALYPFLHVCNEEGAAEVKAKESTRYTGVYLVLEGEPPKYLVFGRDGGLLKIRLEEGMEMMDGKLVET